MENIFNQIYQKTLALKEKIGNRGNHVRIVVPNAQIEKAKYLQFADNAAIPLYGQSVVYINEPVFQNIPINRKFTVQYSKVYTLVDFITLTRTAIQVSSNGVIVDPNLCRIIMINRGLTAIVVDQNVTNVSITMLRNIKSFTRYAGSGSVPLTTTSQYSYFLVVNGIARYVEPVLSNGTYQLPISATGGWATVIQSDDIRVAPATALQNSKYRYVALPSGIGFANTPDIHIFRPNSNAFFEPSAHTPLLDGVIVPDANTSFMLITSAPVPSYTDMRHTYSQYKNYMNEYLANTLPATIASYTPYKPDVDADTPEAEFQAEMKKSLEDFTNFYRTYLEEQASFSLTSYPIITPSSIITRTNPNGMLFFSDGINIAPISITRSANSMYVSRFKDSDITASSIVGVDIGRTVDPYVQYGNITSTTFIVGPSSRVTSHPTYKAFVTSPGTTLRKCDPLPIVSTILDRNLAKLRFNQADVGKHIHVIGDQYNRILTKSNNQTGLLKVPLWASFIPKSDIYVFLNGRLQPSARTYIFDPFRYTVTKGDTVLVTDLDTNIATGEAFTVLLSNQLSEVNHTITLANGNKIIEMTNKAFPFSTKTHLIFVDGKFIHPDKIKVIDNYRFSLDVKSTNKLRIVRKNMADTFTPLLENVKDKWTQYLATLSTAAIESLLGPLFTVTNQENNDRTVYYGERHYFEILYNYCLKDRRMLTPEDAAAIPIELPNVLLPDGRIPISSIRPGAPRYPL
jgi:hypothetical protein